jgi:NADH-quinone oxidoreductase subunit B
MIPPNVPISTLDPPGGGGGIKQLIEVVGRHLGRGPIRFYRTVRRRAKINSDMDKPLASSPVELFTRVDDYSVANAAAAASEGIVFTTLNSAVNWARKNSIWPMAFGLACCAIEMMSMSASRFDISRFGAEVFRGSPRQADLMIIAGRVSNKMAPVVRHLYQQMPEPKWAISMGACATSTGVFNNYALVPVNQVIPIDVFVPGCPPRPEQLIYAIMMLQEKIDKQSGTVKQVLNLA